MIFELFGRALASPSNANSATTPESRHRLRRATFTRTVRPALFALREAGLRIEIAGNQNTER